MKMKNKFHFQVLASNRKFQDFLWLQKSIKIFEAYEASDNENK
jgi:hypothetical protein